MDREGSPSYFLGRDIDSNVHHVEWGLAMGGDLRDAGGYIKKVHDCTISRSGAGPDQQVRLGDLRADTAIGNIGVAMGNNFRVLGVQPQRILPLWKQYVLQKWW
jgi:hypothetical protein